MDLRLVICVAVVAFVAVEARSVVRCQLYCEYGYEPGSYCRCRQFPIQEINPCAIKSCPENTRCEARGRVGVCVPLFSTGPIMPVDPVLPVDPIFPVDPILPVDPTLPITVCGFPKETGPCEGYMPRYYYNNATRTCERFIYGGCGGNKNNFRTLLECNSRCVRQPRRNYY